MENQKEHVQHLLWKHQELSDNQEYNTDEFVNTTLELIETWGFEPDGYELFSFLPVPEGYTVDPRLDDDKVVWTAQNIKTKVYVGTYRTQSEAID